MEKFIIEMPLVKKCDAQNCGFNVIKNCHAKAITIGDNSNPGCDTFMDSTRHTHESKRLAGVGACKVIGCKFNRDYECTTENITVGLIDGEVKCRTYIPR